MGSSFQISLVCTSQHHLDKTITNMSATENKVAADEQVTKGTKRAAEEAAEDAKKLKGEENGEEEVEEEEDLEGEEDEDELAEAEEELDENYYRSSLVLDLPR